MFFWFVPYPDKYLSNKNETKIKLYVQDVYVCATYRVRIFFQSRFPLMRSSESQITPVRLSARGNTPSNATRCGKPSATWSCRRSAVFLTPYAGVVSSPVLPSYISGRSHLASDVMKSRCPYTRDVSLSASRLLSSHGAMRVVRSSTYGENNLKHSYLSSYVLNWVLRLNIFICSVYFETQWWSGYYLL
jgi:hypothetical protein